MIAIVSYGLGNVQAIANIYGKLGVPVTLATEEKHLEAADHIILPGVGAFDRAMTMLDQAGIRAPLERAVHDQRKPVLGICVGMQMLAARSDEGSCRGLDWISGEVKKFDISAFSGRTHLPHMGWNDVHPAAEDPLFRGLESGARFYFLHSFFFQPRHAANVIAQADYYGNFACGVRAENVFGVQFHPEKSHHWGIRLLQNFSEL